MPNPSIYSMIQPVRSVDPIEQYAKVAQLKGMMDASDLHGLQRQKLVGDLNEEAAFKTAISDWVKAGGAGELPAGALAASPTRFTALQKQRLEGKKAEADLQKTNLEIAGKRLSQTRDIIAGIGSEADLPFAREQMMKIHGPDVVAQMPFFQQPFTTEAQQRAVLTADKLLERMTPKMEKVQVDNNDVITTEMVDMNPFTNPGVRNLKIVTQKMASPDAKLADERGKVSLEETKRHNKVMEGRAAEAALQAKSVAERADWQYDSDRGLLVNKRNGTTQAIVGQDGKPLSENLKLTESQGGATAFGLRAQRASDAIIEMENKGTFGKAVAAKQAVGSIPITGGVLEAGANLMMSDANQQYEQAQRDFINAVLRKESGATIQKEEFDNARKQYFPQPGDSDTVMAQKRANRATAIQALTIQAGPGASKIPAPTVQPKPIGKPKSGGIKFLGYEG